jgi:[acyl-carrier-protein] S-malonyltransferase
LGYDLWALAQQGPAEELNKTWQTQPALLTASVALYRVWQQQGGKTRRCWRVIAWVNTPRWFAPA